MSGTPSIVRFAGEEWSALYVDGRLVVCGDHYHVEEWYEGYLAVSHRDEPEADWLPDGRNAPLTLAEVEALIHARDERGDRAARLRAEAARLLEDAAAIDAAKAKNTDGPGRTPGRQHTTP